MFTYTLSTEAVWLSSLVALVMLFEAGRRARWNAPLSEHLIWSIASAAVLIGQWMSFTLPSGLQIHYLGAAFLAVVLGYPRALLSMAVILGLTGEPATWGLRMLLSAALPVWSMWLVVQATRRWLPGNLFVFLLGCGLFGLFTCHALQLATSAVLLLALDPSHATTLTDDYLPYALLLAAGEAWIEGMLITLLVVYLPGSVRLFDERWYLRRR